MQENFSALGANTYMLSGMRVSNNDEKITLALNTSRINKFGEKKGILQFINWSLLIKSKIELYKESENFTSIFAKPIDFETNRSYLVPVGILFNTSKLSDQISVGNITGAYYVVGDRRRSIPLNSVLSFLSKMLNVERTASGRKVVFSVKSNSVKDMILRINRKSITVASSKLRHIYFEVDGEDDFSLLNYLNSNNEYIISFEDIEMIYSNKKLFKDSKLLENIDQFMKVFEPYPELDHTTSEKGLVTTTSTEFNHSSVFRFVEDKFKDSFDYFICDDIGKEWADHIGVSEEEIVFFHSKSKNSLFSASDFQDVFGQAQKNLGNITPTWTQLEKKGIFWMKPYTTTLINRLRSQTKTIPDAIEMWKDTMRNPNVTREVKIVVDFISMSGLKTRLQKLKDGIAFREQNEIVQILWFVSSLVASSQEAGVKCKIVCKP